MRKWTLIIVFLGALFACETSLEVPDAPKDLIPEDTMVQIMEDVMLLEQYIQSRYPRPDQFELCLKKSGDQVLEKRGMEYERFDRSLNYYASLDGKMKELYSMVMTNMNQKVNELRSQRAKNKL
ncbi:MAG: DUF4296 domain-containing protein [Bacteroidetes bacterium]|nr:MAG: DUF4296 domain-containing protein [Bacteroidota bacterium]